MNKFSTDDPAHAKAAIEMYAVANEYCLFFEDAEKFEPGDLFTFFQRIGPLLYLKGSLLPEIEGYDDDEYAERFVTEEQWEDVFKTLRQKFDADDLYFVLDTNFDTREASLADNLADIYQDMKDFVMLFQKGSLTSKQSAVAQIKSLFSDHWGPILINALGAVHRVLFRNQIDPDLFKEEDNW